MNHTYWIFLVMAVVTVSSPGPGVLMTLDNAIAQGWRAAMHGVVGLALGAALMAGLSSAGMGLLVRSSPKLHLLLKLGGAGYLLYLACQTWRRMPAPIAATAAGATRLAGGHRGLLLRGTLLQTSNPKSLLFFLSVLGGVRSQMPLALAIATYCVALLLIHAAYAGLASRARVWLSQPRTARALSRASALVFFAFGIALLAREFQ